MSRIPVPSHPAQSPMSVFSQTSGRESPLQGRDSPADRGTRLKQGKRDEAIRKKIESELSRKRTGAFPSNNRNNSHRKQTVPKKGTVAGLKPSPALTVPEGMSVADASQLCAAKRTDCVLVVDDEEGLSGIFTAKDLAFRITAESLDPRNTPVSAIMTRNPMVTRDTTSATEALQLMVSRGFRHLPVCNEEGDVVGLLDITKVFHEALAKVERGSSASAQLSAALAGVQSELGPNMAHNPQAAAMLAYVDSLKEKMALPDLTTVLDPSKPAATVSPRTSVREAAILMKERRTTAVCVMEVIGGQNKIVGIFTSKDVVLRVIAAGLDATRCSVVRVMTPHPDTALPTLSVQDALKKMHNGHYLNLPVVDSEARLVGIVDVLKLTYATLEQIGNMNTDSGTGSDAGGPMWGKFFESIGGAMDDDAISGISSSHAPASSSAPNALRTPSRNQHIRNDSYASSVPEVLPGDSASAVGMQDDGSDVGGHGQSVSVSAPVAVLVDDGTYVFKFKTPSGRTHRFQARSDMIENLREIVGGKLVSDPFFLPSSEEDHVVPDPADFTLSYTDDDGDLVHMTSDSDVTDAVTVARAQKTDKVLLVLSGGKAWEDALKAQRQATEASAAPSSLFSPPVGTPGTMAGLPALTEEDLMEVAAASTPGLNERLTAFSVDPALEPAMVPSAKVHSHSAPAPIPELPTSSSKKSEREEEEKVAGIPKDLLLPASIGFLGVVVLGVFVVGRLGKK
ncbi:Phox/Bem1p [Phaffia rhodozyma]|uniref:Phox/Bem1p n=1 Tax=Phaffia rhodozyma TaxID=264483 RepID=A0A0F7SX93_PHARH|nr:Phox/Bem1p [Phaffia rhodozyma]